MAVELTTTMIAHLADLISLRLSEATCKVKISLTLINSSLHKQACDILLDIEHPLHEARSLLNAIAALQRDDDG